MLIKTNHRFNKYLSILLLLMIIGSFIFSFSYGLNNDELFTMGLIRHGYLSLIHIDELDVHPPLYYLVLKTFLSITTFWTSSVIIKVLFARLFSLLCFIGTFIILNRILKFYGININYWTQFLVYMAYPSILRYSVTIRMYQFDVLLITIELFGLVSLKFSKHNQMLNLTLILIATLSSFYTNYFSAIFAGVLLIIEWSNYSIIQRLRRARQIFIIGIISLILFAITMFKFTFHQVNYVSQFSYNNYEGVPKSSQHLSLQFLGALTGNNVNNSQMIIIDAIVLLILITTIVSTVRSSQTSFKRLIIKLYLTFIIGLIPSLIFSYLTHPILQWRYGFPMFAIIFYFSIMYSINKIHIISYKSLLLIALILINVQPLISNHQSIQIKKSEVSNAIRKPTKNINDHHSQRYRKIDQPLVNSIYRPKETINVKNLSIKPILASNNQKLLYKTFNNLKLK